jgi:hypothetical protein
VDESVSAKSRELTATAQAVRRIRDDRGLLLQVIQGRSEAEMRSPHHVAGGPLGDFCESLHDLVAHVLMWDEINVAVLTEAKAGRPHWSLDARWEAPPAGRALNEAGVIGGRSIPSSLLIHRYTTTVASLAAELESTPATSWEAPLPFGTGRTLGELAARVMTVPGQPQYWHAAIHLRVDMGREEAF